MQITRYGNSCEVDALILIASRKRTVFYRMFVVLYVFPLG